MKKWKDVILPIIIGICSGAVLSWFTNPGLGVIAGAVLFILGTATLLIDLPTAKNFTELKSQQKTAALALICALSMIFLGALPVFFVKY